MDESAPVLVPMDEPATVVAPPPPPASEVRPTAVPSATAGTGRGTSSLVMGSAAFSLSSTARFGSVSDIEPSARDYVRIFPALPPTANRSAPLGVLLRGDLFTAFLAILPDDELDRLIEEDEEFHRLWMDKSQRLSEVMADGGLEIEFDDGGDFFDDEAAEATDEEMEEADRQREAKRRVFYEKAKAVARARVLGS